MSEFLSNYGWAILGMGLMIFMHTKMHGKHGAGGGGCCGGGHQPQNESPAKANHQHEVDKANHVSFETKTKNDSGEEAETNDKKKDDKGISTCCY